MEVIEKKIKVIILGADGMLGHKFVDILSKEHDVYGTVRRAEDRTIKNNKHLEKCKLFYGIDAKKFNLIEEKVSSIKPDFILNCIGLTKSLCSNKEMLEAIYLNSQLPHMIAKLAARENSKLIHFSTDCVFSGELGLYDEKNIPDARDLYGLSKILGEVTSYDHCLTIRKSTIGLELNSTHGLIEWFLNKANSMEGFSRAIYSGITSVELARIVSFIMLRDEFINGLFHIASEPISKYELLKKLSILIGKDINISKNNTFNCDRSLNGSKFFEHTGYNIPSWDFMLKELADEIINKA